jgi:hypothetical protein
VIVAEGNEDPLYVGRAVFSGARVVLLALAPPGLVGWPFVAGWSPPSLLTAERAEVARPEHLRAAAGLGMTMWTHMPVLADLASAAGVPCRFIGNGSPKGPPPPVGKHADVAWLRENRWAPLAEPIARRLDAHVDAVELVDHDEMLHRLGEARILLWPSRLEGHGRISLEARSVGCVPVALASNVFATGLDEDSGAVAVGSVDELPEVIERLLEDPDRLAALAEQGRRSATAQLDWAAYVQRVGDGLRELEGAEDPAAGGRALIAARIDELLAAAETRAGDADRAVQRLSVEVERLTAEVERLTTEHHRLSVRFAMRAAALIHRRR